MADEIQNKLLQLVNEKNDLYRDVTFENVVMGEPNPVTETGIFKTYSSPGTHIWTVPDDQVIQLDVYGAGGGSGGSISDTGSGNNRGSNKCSGRGGHGAFNAITLNVMKGDTLTFIIGLGGQGGDGLGIGNGTYGRDGRDGQSGETTYIYHNDVLVVEVAGGGGGDGTPYDRSPDPMSGVDALPLGGMEGGASSCPIQGYSSEAGKVIYQGQDGNDGNTARIELIRTINGLDFRNTSVSLTGILNQGYRGTTDVFYRRHDLTELFVGEEPLFRTRDVAFESILGKLNLLYGISLKVDDVANVDTFPVWDETELEVTKSFELVVKDTSYGWTGTVTFDVVQGNPLLESVVVVQLLPILTHPDVPEELNGKQSGKLMTWMVDFTPWKDELLLNSGDRMWSNFARIQEIGREVGLDYWYNNRVIDFPTSAVPHANPRFERVKIQTYAGGGVVGPLYFHYDENW